MAPSEFCGIEVHPKTPKVIHQSWKTKEIPDALRLYQESWRKQNPTYDYKLWTDNDNERVVKSKFPKLWDTYANYPVDIERFDLSRLAILYEYGGIYADLDFECLRSFDLLMSQNNFICGTEPPEHKYAIGKQLLCNALMISPPRHPFVKHYLDILPSRKELKDPKDVLWSVMESTGPLAMTEAYQSYAGPDIVVMEPDVFYPEASPFERLSKKYQRRLETKKYPAKSYGAHHWGTCQWGRLFENV